MKHNDHRITFGKFKNKLVSQLKDSELKQVAKLKDPNEKDVIDQAKRLCKERGIPLDDGDNGNSKTPKKSKKEIEDRIKLIHSKLSLEYHPDKTGDEGKAQKALNEFLDGIKKTLNEYYG